MSMGRSVEVIIIIRNDKGDEVHRERHIESLSWENFVDGKLDKAVRSARTNGLRKMFGAKDE